MKNFSWNRFQKYLYKNNKLGLAIDISRMKFTENFFLRMQEKAAKALREMDELEKGVIANADEKRMVGHYWLRNANLAPNEGIRKSIENTIERIKEFVQDIHEGKILSSKNKSFTNILLIGIGGSALGPQFVTKALSSINDKMSILFLDNTDPQGMDIIFHQLKDKLDETLAIIISKSGGTKETRNGMLETKYFFEINGIDFSSQAVAITAPGSDLEKLAKEEKWLNVFPVWDWVGGRTSETSAVGLLPAALQGFDIDGLLEGARDCDIITRNKEIFHNPALLLALMWYYFTQGQGGKGMVILPYKDRLQLMTRYLQQLIMESLGKEKDRDNNLVEQGIFVFGNKGSTDQHSYIQQLLEGPNNLFVNFIEVLQDRDNEKLSLLIEEQATSGDYLYAFLQGTREALTEKGKESITITIEQVNAYTIGVLIALYERTVGFYASLVNINAYHQPAVERGKKAAQTTLEVQRKVLEHLQKNKGIKYNLREIAEYIKYTDLEKIYKILQHLIANPDHGVQCIINEDLEKEIYYINLPKVHIRYNKKGIYC